MRDRIILTFSSILIVFYAIYICYDMLLPSKIAFADENHNDELYEPLPPQDTPWYIHMDLYNQIVTVHAIDENGEYTNVINQFPCSGGMAARNTESKTPYMFLELYSGIGNKTSYMRRRDWGEWGWVEYITNIYGKFLFHSVLYESRAYSAYIHHSYDDITFSASHGCVRLLSQDVKWLYDNLEPGVLCDVTKSEPNPELSQLYQPLPPKDSVCVATMPPNFGFRTTEPPKINWDILNDDPTGYVPGNFE